MGSDRAVRAGRVDGQAGPRSDNRRFISVLIWMARSGGRWRDRPERYGNYHTVKKRDYRWVEAGVLNALFDALAGEAERDWVPVASTSIRARSQAAGARRKRGDRRPRVLGVRAAA